MKIARLDLRAYGPFDRARLDFPEAGPSLHLIHGPNEAGKSTALRALRALLFGFPRQTGDDHRFEYGKLRVGATLVAPRVGSIEVVRRKGNAKTLRAADDEAVLADDALVPYLGAIDEGRYRAVAMTNLAELVEGGAAILAGRGDFGEILFGASGLSGLAEVRRKLIDEAEQLFKGAATARKPLINASLASLEIACKAAADAILPTASWREADRDEKAARAGLSSIDADLARDEAEHRRLDRLGRALPLLASRREVEARLAAIGDVPILPDGFAAQRLKAEAERTAAVEEARNARDDAATISAALAGADPSPRLLAEAEAINSLREERGAVRKAATRRPRLLEKAARADAGALDLLREVDPTRPIAEARGLRVGKRQADAIKALSLDRGAIEAEVGRAAGEVRSLLATVGDRPGPISPASRRDLDDLAALVARVQAGGDLDLVVRRAEAAGRRAIAEAEAELRRLPHWSGTLDDLATRPVPDELAVLGLADAIESNGAALSANARAIAANLADRGEVERQATLIRASGDPPTEADLTADRAAREASWLALRDAWASGPPADRLVSAHERAVVRADATADGLRREAERVATLASLTSRLGQAREAGDRLEEDRGACLLAVERAEAAWGLAWKAAEIEPGSPVAMRGWSARHREALARLANARAAGANVEEARAERDRAFEELDRAMVGLGEGPAGAGEGLAGLLDRARRVVERGEAARELDAARGRQAEAEKVRAGWLRRWGEAVRPLGLDADARPEEAEATLGRIGSLLESLDEAEAARAEVAEIDREAGRFDREVVDLARRVGEAEDPEASPDRIVDGLVAALDEAGRVRARREAESARHAAVLKRLEKAERVVRDRDALLDALRREAGCDDLASLPAAERASAERSALLAKLGEVEDQVLALGGGAGVDQVAREARGIDPDSLPGQLRTLLDRVEAGRAARDALNREVGRLGGELARMDGGPEGGAAEEEVRRWQAAIEADVEQYVRLKLASATLRRAIDRYREANQGPILRRLGDLFAALTAGSFAGVILDDEGEGPPILRGVRGGPRAEQVAVEGMSEGTANALHLAARLATLEAHLDGHPPLPVVVDDILVNFDDVRASAALRALADLSTRTQVLFFTHHEHLVELASRSLPAASWTLHRLGRPSA